MNEYMVLFSKRSQGRKKQKKFGFYINHHSGPIRRRMTDTDGFWETPHPSSVAEGMGGPNPPSVIRNGWYRWAKPQSVHCHGSNRDRTTDTDDGWGVGHPSVPKKPSVRPLTGIKMSVPVLEGG